MRRERRGSGGTLVGLEDTGEVIPMRCVGGTEQKGGTSKSLCEL